MKDDWQQVLPVQRRLSQLLAEFSGEQRDLALVYLRTGDAIRALELLEPYLAKCPADEVEALTPYVRRPVGWRPSETKTVVVRGGLNRRHGCRWQTRNADGAGTARRWFGRRPLPGTLSRLTVTDLARRPIWLSRSRLWPMLRFSPGI